MRALLPLLLLSLTSPLAAGVITLFDTDFQNANWTTIVLGANGGMTAANTRIATGGNPAGAYRQLTLQWPVISPGGQSSANVASFSPLLEFLPIGAITGIQFDYDLAKISTTGLPPNSLAGNYRPLLQQNGRTYFLANVANLAVSTAWTTFSNFSTNPNDWGEINNGVTLPDFSANAPAITFGYRGLLILTCPSGGGSCLAGTAVSGLDNYRVTITYDDPQPAVPEPGTVTLCGAALLVAAAARRARSVRRSRAAE
ncbi:MAG TPA: hypothetical protein DEH78_02290 [Solibacterales bacterium]|nr:hypothetical protein [Bryobacterales bacterium]